MDTQSSEMPKTVTSFNFDEEQFENFIYGTEHDYLEPDIQNIPSLPLSPSNENIALSTNVSYETVSPDDSDPVLRFLNQILMEENMEERPSMFHDPLALQATEKSLYEVIGQKYPPSPYNPVNHGNSMINGLDEIFASPTEYTNGSNAGSNSTAPQWTVDGNEYNASVEQDHQQSLQPSSHLLVSSQVSSISVDSSNTKSNQKNSFEDVRLLQSIFTDSDSIMQFKKGVEEASKFLPPSFQLNIDLDKYDLPQKTDGIPSSVSVHVEKNVIPDSQDVLKRRKNWYPEDGSDDVERSSKQSAVYLDEVELSEMFDRVLLCSEEEATSCNSEIKFPNRVEPPNESNSGRAHAKKNENKLDYVDLSTLLIRCAESVAADDRRVAFERLKQIHKYSSPTGDADQRLASIFASGLQARLCGTGNELYASLNHKRITSVEKLKAYQAYLLACPFEKLSIYLADMMIGFVASEATTLHIIDFGVLYGFQWPGLIQGLSERAGGPPKLRITGIELPQPGFKPEERVEETGSRLATYCKRFGVPFEYHAIASKNWETIKFEDLKIASGEMIAVNCLFRLDKLPDVEVDNPRDSVLNLIRKIKPDIFVNAVTNGSFSAPFFVTRFKEALFHFSALLDMFDATMPRDSPERMNFEQEFYGREVINAIACEGSERVERPETYKKWHARHMRAGFKPLPLNPEIINKLRYKAKVGFHKEFLFGEDGNWMLQGWKGRVICASSCWVPS